MDQIKIIIIIIKMTCTKRTLAKRENYDHLLPNPISNDEIEKINKKK